jgi:hypothetical protein
MMLSIEVKQTSRELDNRDGRVAAYLNGTTFASSGLTIVPESDAKLLAENAARASEFIARGFAAEPSGLRRLPS